jgi:DNA (cytosine-5)-methyltransferase 1
MKSLQAAGPLIRAVDLFCGAGGLTCGLRQAGVDVKAGVDLDPACEYAYKVNNKAEFLLRSVDQVSPEELSRYFEGSGFSLLAGCAPCQPFSLYRQGRSDESDGRWHLLRSFQRLAEKIHPTFITMENVPRLRDQDIFRDFKSSLERKGYQVWSGVVNSALYGVPQERERLVLLASKIGPISLIPPTHKGKTRTVRGSIEKLPRIQAGTMDFQDHLHQAAGMDPINVKRIKASVPGGTWRDWPKSLVAECHKKKSGKTYPSVYGRMVWDAPSPTITTQFYGFGNGRFGHPEQNRAISLREGAILQSFPKSYKFAPPGAPISFTSVGRLIGNSVPVKLGKAIGQSFMNHAREYGVHVTSKS